MVTQNRRDKFIRNFVKKTITKNHGIATWRIIYSEYLVVYKSLKEAYKCQKYRRRVAWRQIYAARPECKHHAAIMKWRLFRTSQKKMIHALKIKTITRRLPRTRAMAIRAMAAERERQADHNRAEKKELIKDESIKRAHRKLVRIAETKARAEEKLAKQIEVTMIGELMADVERKEEITKQVEAALKAADGVKVEETGPMDLLRDIQWVYSNLANLFKTTEAGVTMLDAEILKLAPSNGAIAIAQYAAIDKKAFFEKFVVKLLPRGEKAAEAVGEDADEEEKENLDPDMGDLDKYMQGVAGE